MGEFRGQGDDHLNKGIIYDLKTYEELFKEVASTVHEIGESSVFYLYFHDVVIPQMKQAVPDAKIIISLRNPIDRAYSAFMHLVRDSREPLSFWEGIQEIEARKSQHYEPIWDYIGCGYYNAAVRHFQDAFGRDNVKVLIYDDILADIAVVMKDIFQFLEVHPDVAIDTSLKHNVSGIPKHRWLYNLVFQESLIKDVVKGLMPIPLRHAIKEQTIAKFRSRGAYRQSPLDTETRAKVYQTFYQLEIEQLEYTLQLDLSAWKG